MNLEDLNPALMMQPVLNKIIALANDSIVCKPKIKKCRLELSTTPLYHSVLDEMFREAQKAVFRNKKLYYPTLKYLANIEIRWMPREKMWEVKITNGGTNRKNASLKRKVLHVIYVRKLKGIYLEDKAPITSDSPKPPQNTRCKPKHPDLWGRRRWVLRHLPSEVAGEG